MDHHPVKAIGIIGSSGAGKTTLLEALIGRFCSGGMRVAAIKHAHHGFDLDRPGKDSYRFRAAGARQVLISSGDRWALLSEEEEEVLPDPGAALARQLGRLAPCDLILVEGFRGQAGLPFIEVRRQGTGDGDARAAAAGLVAIAADAATRETLRGSAVPVLDLDDIDGIARFIALRLELAPC